MLSKSVLLSIISKESREEIYHLLKENNYSRKYKGLAKWEDWYVRF